MVAHCYFSLQIFCSAAATGKVERSLVIVRTLGSLLLLESEAVLDGPKGACVGLDRIDGILGIAAVLARPLVLKVQAKAPFPRGSQRDQQTVHDAGDLPPRPFRVDFESREESLRTSVRGRRFAVAARTRRSGVCRVPSVAKLGGAVGVPTLGLSRRTSWRSSQPSMSVRPSSTPSYAPASSTRSWDASARSDAPALMFTLLPPKSTNSIGSL